MTIGSEPDPAAVEALRRDLDNAGFSVGTLTALWGDAADAALFRGQRVPALRALQNNKSPVSTLAQLFVLGIPTTTELLDAALPTLGRSGAVELGLVTVDGSRVLPALDVRPYEFVDAQGAGSFTVASDLGELALGGPIPEGHVLGVGGASRTLSGITVRRPVGSVLDLGTGCGIQALHAARHATRVVATDISERALGLATLNAQLADVTNVEFRNGSLFEPVAGERFDLIVSNPPFVITPRAEGVPSYEYRDGGLEGDDLVATVVRSAGNHLNPGGIAQLLGNWEHREQSDGLDRVAEWVEESGLDAWVIEREVQSVEEYAETWIRDGGIVPGSGQFDRLYGAWLDDFEKRGVRSVGFGYITLRRPTAGLVSLRRFERLHGALGSTTLGEAIDSSLRAHDALLALGVSEVQTNELADARLTTTADVTEERHYWPGAEHPTVMTLKQGGGFGRTVSVDTAVAAVVGACDGDLSIRAIVAAVAHILEADAEALLDEVLPTLRELVFTGFLRLEE